MKSYRKELWFDVPAKQAFVYITGQVEECLRESTITEGLILVGHVQYLTSPAGVHLVIDIFFCRANIAPRAGS